MFKKISVIGLGYIGLPTAAVFAARKLQVIGVDIRQDVVETINKGGVHIVEPDLDMVVHAVVKEGYLKATTKTEPADAFIIAVPTPFIGKNHEPDLKYIKSACEGIAAVLKKGDLVVLESTSPVGATERVEAWLKQLRPDLTFPSERCDDADIQIAHCPERVLPGHIMRELVENDRIIGGISKKCSEKAVQLYKMFVQGECIITNARTAEMAKLTENSFRDVNIAFANELSLICDKQGIDVWELITLTNRHPRVNILQPGPGVGGHCIAVDPWFIVNANPDEAKLIHTARTVNDYKPIWVINKLKIALADFLQSNPQKKASDVTIAFYGLAFKANIDDLRESPSLEIVNKVAEFHLGSLITVEPNIDALPKEMIAKNIKLVDINEAITNADIHLILVPHNEFKSINFEKLKNKTVIRTVAL